MAVFPIEKTPLIVAGLFIWLDAVDPAGNGTIPSNGSALASWVDKSGRGNTFSQGSGGAQPTFNTNQLSGLPAVAFDGSSKYMTCANAASNLFSTNQNLSVFAVLSNTDPTQARDNFIVSKGFFPSGGWAAYSQQSTGKYSFVTNTVNQYASSNLFVSSTFEIYTGLLNASGGEVTFYKNGSGSDVISGSTGSAANSTQQLTLGIDGTLTRFWPGSMAEILVYGINVGTTNAALIMNYLKNKWGR